MVEAQALSLRRHSIVVGGWTRSIKGALQAGREFEAGHPVPEALDGFVGARVVSVQPSRAALLIGCLATGGGAHRQFIVRCRSGRLELEFPCDNLSILDDACVEYWLRDPEYPDSDGYLWERRAYVDDLASRTIICFRYTRDGLLIGASGHPGLIVCAATESHSGDDFLSWYRDE